MRAGHTEATVDLLRLAGEATAGIPLLPALLTPDRWLLWLGLLLQERADRNLRENILAKCVVVAVEEISGHGDGFRVELDEQD